MTAADGARDEALDSLEMMVRQYMPESAPEGGYDHLFMSAGEAATEVLVKQRLNRWRAVTRGVERIT
jgi:hypothetical protein